MKKLNLILSLVLVFSFSLVHAQTCELPGFIGGDGGGVSAAIGQSFTACQDGVIAKICFGAHSSQGSTTAPDKVQIYDSGDPSTGTPVYEVINPTTYTEGSGSTELVCHDVETVIEISNGEMNSVVFALDVAQFAPWGYDNNNYNDGVMYYNQGASARPDLFYFPNGDAQFKVELGPPPAAPVPTMGEWALTIFGLMIVSLGTVSVMRWQREQKLIRETIA